MCIRDRINAVTGSGIASVAHQLAINNTTPVTYQPEIESPAGGEVRSVKERKIKPIKKPIVFGLEKFFIKKRREINRALFRLTFSKLL